MSDLRRFRCVAGLLLAVVASARKASSRIVSKDVSEEVRQRMAYWQVSPESAATTPRGDRYLLFDHDPGGLNNIRIGWEMAALAARVSDRTLVYPPRERLYLLTSEDSGMDYFVDMDRVRAGVPVMSLAEFVAKEGHRLGMPESVLEWAKSPDNDVLPASEWITWRAANMRSAGPDDNAVCNINTYKVDDKLMYTSTKDGGGRIFSCGNWPNVGEPRFRQGEIGTYGPRWDAPAEVFKMLRNNFIWHPDVFDIASRVVQELGIFKYAAVHARYGDFQFQNHKLARDTLLKDGWLSLLEQSQASQKRSSFLEQTHFLGSARAAARGREVMHALRHWLRDEEGGGQIYIATDETDPGYKQPFIDNGITVTKWSDLLEEGQRGSGPLAEPMRTFSPERLSNLAGPIEQVICTFGKVFVGSEKSTFTGYIERMRLYAQAPTHATYIRYNGMDAEDIGLRMFHDRAIDPAIESKVRSMVKDWERQGGVLDRSDPGLLPLDAA